MRKIFVDDYLRDATESSKAGQGGVITHKSQSRGFPGLPRACFLVGPGILG